MELSTSSSGTLWSSKICIVIREYVYIRTLFQEGLWVLDVHFSPTVDFESNLNVFHCLTSLLFSSLYLPHFLRVCVCVCVCLPSTLICSTETVSPSEGLYKSLLISAWMKRQVWNMNQHRANPNCSRAAYKMSFICLQEHALTYRGW